MFRKCFKCNNKKTLTEFYKNKSEPLGHSYVCKSCGAEYNRNWRMKNLKKAAEINKKWKKNNPEKVYVSKLKRDYNITLNDFEILLKKQNYLCSICSIEIEKPYIAKKLNIETAYVDHSHETMNIRGLLCQHCNTAIGFFKDDVIIIENAIKYLNNASTTDGKDTK